MSEQLRDESPQSDVPTEILVRARGVEKRFGDVEVLKGVDLDVPAGETLCLMGRSGSGKSTFLRCLNQLEPIDGGLISIGGELAGLRQDGERLKVLNDRAVAQQRAKVGMVFQQFNLFPHMTVLQNIIEGPTRVLKRDRSEVVERARELLGRVDLADRADSYPSHLSGGQQQRVAIVRALAMEPRLMLFDEPTSALDPELVGEVLSVIRDVALSGMTVIVVTHEIGFAREVADRIAFMDDGRIAEIGPSHQVLTSPTQPATRQFLSAILD